MHGYWCKSGLLPFFPWIQEERRRLEAAVSSTFPHSLTLPTPINYEIITNKMKHYFKKSIDTICSHLCLTCFTQHHVKIQHAVAFSRNTFLSGLTTIPMTGYGSLLIHSCADGHTTRIFWILWVCDTINMKEDPCQVFYLSIDFSNSFEYRSGITGSLSNSTLNLLRYCQTELYSSYPILHGYYLSKMGTLYYMKRHGLKRLPDKGPSWPTVHCLDFKCTFQICLSLCCTAPSNCASCSFYS